MARLRSLVFEAADPAGLARFWADALEWSFLEHEGGRSVAAGGDGELRRLEFVGSSGAKTSANWTHFDLATRSLEHQQATVARLVGLGARHLDIGQGPDAAHVVLADPEDNEFCVLEPGNRFVDDGGLLGSLSSDGSRAAGVFWSEVLGWPLVWDQDDETAIRPASGTGLFITFGGTPDPSRRESNRLVLELVATADGEVDRLVALGATRIDDGQGGDVVHLSDPDGNAFRILVE
ncbi:MAG TPA: VOC family protein [Acidimicrobiales bacterium]|nr:VOC family protein [Acidimicrobiales bacterium]